MINPAELELPLDLYEFKFCLNNRLYCRTESHYCDRDFITECVRRDIDIYIYDERSGKHKDITKHYVSGILARGFMKGDKEIVARILGREW
jgi:polyhydroxyalkanoate synthesis regulator protein